MWDAWGWGGNSYTAWGRRGRLHLVQKRDQHAKCCTVLANYVQLLFQNCKRECTDENRQLQSHFQWLARSRGDSESAILYSKAGRGTKDKKTKANKLENENTLPYLKNQCYSLFVCLLVFCFFALKLSAELQRLN